MRHPVPKLLDRVQMDLRAVEAECGESAALRAAFGKLTQLRSYDYRHVPISAGLVACDQCSVEFLTERERDLHVEREHPQPDPERDPDGIERIRELAQLAAARELERTGREPAREPVPLETLLDRIGVVGQLRADALADPLRAIEVARIAITRPADTAAAVFRTFWTRSSS